MNKVSVITYDELEDVLQSSLSSDLRKECESANLVYEEISDKDRDEYLLDVISLLFKNNIHRDSKPAGVHRLQEWEKGWNENLDALKNGKDVKNLVPRYHGKHKLIHWRQRMIRPITSYFDYKIHCILVDWAVQTFLNDVENIYEFGCGPGYHLLRIRQYYPDVKLVGLDWTKTSQEIIEQIIANGIGENIEGLNFDFYKPDYSMHISQKTGFLTVAALEQVGENFEEFLQFILTKKPKICVHLEPIDELLDQDNLIDQLSIMYFRKRNYLKGFLPRLRELEKEGRIQIINAQRTYTGSYFIEGHSLIVWQPL